MQSILFRLRGTVILKIWFQILFITLYTTGVLCLFKFALGWRTDGKQVEENAIKFQKENTVAIFGLFTGFLLVFRTNAAYDRYWEGRKLWSTMTSNIRSLTRVIWTMVSFDKLGSTNKLIIEQISTINLLAAFAYATRNFLRENHSYEERDLGKLIKHVPKLREKIEQEKASIDNPLEMPRNIPIEISHLIMSYIRSCREKGLVDDPTTTTLNNALNNLVECIAAFERILKTPIPIAYSVHLHHAIWLYFLALPIQLMAVLDWFTIPVVASAAFAMLGILDIGWQIESPFGFDENDLPLDQFCEVIYHEILNIIGNPMPPAESWILSQDNYPFIPESSLPAKDLVKLSECNIRNILARFRYTSSNTGF